jgi:hypothetical protein
MAGVPGSTAGFPAITIVAFITGRFPRGHKRDLSGFLVTHPVPLPCSKTPAESVVLAIADFPMLPPVPNTPKASALP